MDAITVIEATAVDDDLLAAMATLVKELSPTTPAPTATDVTAIIESACTTLLIARDASVGGRIIGMLTLAMFRIPTGVRAWIEDVAVDSRARGKGAGKALCREALMIAWRHGARTVDLTSRPSRKEANGLYQRLGFVPRKTNVYRIKQDSTTT